MTVRRSIAVPNSLLLVTDKQVGEIPLSMEGQLVAATPSCIAVGTIPAADGETLVVLTSDAFPATEKERLRNSFIGLLVTPSKEVHVCLVSLESVAQVKVASTRAAVEIWTDDFVAPTSVYVVIK